MGRNKLLIYLVVLLSALMVSFFATRAHLEARSIGILIFFLVFIPTVINPDIGFIFIIVSMLFSPEFIVGKTTVREISIRIEDIFLLVVILAAFIRTGFTKEVFKAFRTELTVPFFLYFGVCVMSTTLTLVFGRIEIDVRQSFFTLLKYLEYFLFFLMVKHNVRSLKQVKIFVAVFLLTALSVGIYSNIFIQQQQAMGVHFFRVSPPIETREHGEPGTLGGYLIFTTAIAGGLLLYMRPFLPKAFLICLIALIFRAFLYTLSRGSYLAFPFMLLVLFFFSRKKIIFAYILVISLVLITQFIPLMVRERITQTIVTKEGVEGPYLELEESPMGRLQSWKSVLFGRLPASPIIGHGVGRYFIDSQIFLTLSEVGLGGFFLLVWVLVRLFKKAKDIFNLELIKNDEFSVGLSAGFLAGFAGLLVQSISTNTFIIIRIMEPFWFIAAIVLSLPDLLPQEKEL